MRRRISISCLCLAWLCANGAIWDVVQVVAWGRMYADFSNRFSPLGALAKTFDGTEPCALCRAVHQAKETARDQMPRDAALGDAAERLLLVADEAPAVVVTAPEADWPATIDAAGMMRTDTVPVPPPRA